MTTKMRGSLRSPSKNSCRILLVLPAVAACFLSGCKGSEEAGQQEMPRETLKDFLGRYERTFDPSKYVVQLPGHVSQIAQDSAGTSLSPTDSTVVLETTAGFRVQVLTTKDIDQATELRDTLSLLLHDDWVYIVYDSPYYKVRVGNYSERPSANKALKALVEKRYNNAWIVPDQVLKNPPLKPPPPAPVIGPDQQR